MFTLVCLSFFLQPQASEQRTQAFQISGTIKEVLVKPGDTIKPGQVLARLDEKELSQEVTRQLLALVRSYFDVHSARASQQDAEARLTVMRSGKWCGSFLDLEITEFRLQWAQLQASKIRVEQKMAILALHQIALKRKHHVLASDFTGTVATIHKRAGESIRGYETLLTIRTPEESTLGFQVSGKIKEVLVKSGDKVKVGQVLARLDDSLIRKEVDLNQIAVKKCKLEVEGAVADYLVAKAIFERDDVFFKKNIISKEDRDISEALMVKAKKEVDKAKEEVEIAKTVLEKANLELQRHTLTSDFDGTVKMIHKCKHEIIKAQETFITIKVQPQQ